MGFGKDRSRIVLVSFSYQSRIDPVLIPYRSPDFVIASPKNPHQRV